MSLHLLRPVFAFSTLTLMVLCGPAATAETLVTPGVALDLPNDDRATGIQTGVAAATDGSHSLVIYYDARDDSVRAVVVQPDGEGSSRDAVLLSIGADAHVAYGPSGFMVVWADDDGVHGQRLQIADALLVIDGDPFLIDDTDTFSHPRVGWGPGDWLVVYRRGGGETGAIAGTVVGDAGGMAAIADPVADAAQFELSSGAIGYALAYLSSGGTAHARLVHIDASGGVASDSQMTSASVASGTAVSVLATTQGGVVVWADPAGTRLFGRTFDASLLPTGVVTPLTSVGTSVTEASVASDGVDRWLLYVESGVVMARSWTTGGTLGQSVELSDGSVSSPVSASASGHVLGLWHDTADGGGDIDSSILRQPEPTSPRPLTIGGGPRTSGALVQVGGDWIAAWSAPTGPGHDDVYLARADSDGLPIGEIALVATGSADQNGVTLAYDGARLLVAWVEDGQTIHGRRYTDADPNTPDGAAFSICAEMEQSAVPVATAHSGTDFLLAYETDFGSAGRNIRAVLVPASAGDGDCGIDLTAASDVDAFGPRLAHQGSLSLVAWREGTDVIAVTVDAALTASAQSQIDTGAAPLDSVDVSALGTDGWLAAVARVDQTNGGTDLVVIEFNAALSEVETSPVPGAVGDDDRSPLLTVVGDQAGLVWLRNGAVQYIRYLGSDTWDSGGDIEVVPVASTRSAAFAAAGSDLNEIGVLTHETDRSAARTDERLVLRRVLTDQGPVSDADGPYQGFEGSLIRLDGTGSVVTSDATITGYQWTVDGGDPIAGDTVDVSFLDDGLIPVRLVVTDSLGRTSVDLIEVLIVNVAPNVSLNRASYTLDEGAEAGFVATWDDPGVADLVTLRWTFGDGASLDGPAGETTSPSYSYPEGDFEVCVVAEDKEGARAEACAPVTVVNAAPMVTIGEVSPLNEGEELDFSLTITDGGDDTLDIEYDFGDGTQTVLNNVNAPYPTAGAHVYADNVIPDVAASPFNLCVTATDDEGDFERSCRAVTVANVPPRLDGTPSTEALEGVSDYSAAFTVVDPGSDVLVVSLDTGGLEGVTVDYQATEGTIDITFTPMLAQWRTRQPARWTFELEVDDGDATDSESWTVELIPLDANGDGLPDTCAEEWSVSDPGHVDSDGEGVDNAGECLAGTDPTTDNRPTQPPTLNAPANDGEVDVLVPPLSVVNVPHPEDITYQYDFEIYDDPALQAENWVGGDRVDEGETVSVWTSPSLIDGERYYWRARATDGLFNGGFMDVADFTVVIPNNPAPAPELLSPEGEIRESVPTFRWNNVADPDGDTVTYILEIYRDTDDLERRASDIAETEGEASSYTLNEIFPLEDNSDYSWTITPTDSRGLVGVTSESTEFRVNTTNDLPYAPTIVSPEDGSTVTTSFPELVVTEVSDDDGDLLTYSFVLALDPEFDQILVFESDVSPGDGGMVRHTVSRELDEDTTYHWRAAARDHRGLGGFVQGAFWVNAQNNAPPGPVWQQPTNGQVLTETEPDLVVRNVTDPENDSYTYEFELDENSQFVESIFWLEGVVPDDGDETRLALGIELEDRAYVARVRATDEFGAEGDWSTIQFFINSGPPELSAPTPIFPEAGSTVAPTEIGLVVENAVIESEEAATYVFEVFTDDLLSERIYLAQDIPEGDGQTSHVLGRSFTESTYYWHARALSGDLATPWSDTWAFNVQNTDFGDDGAVDGDVGVDGDADVGGGDSGATGDGDDGCGCATRGGGQSRVPALTLALVTVGLVLRRRR